MKRKTTTPRPDWQERVESLGFLFHSLPDEYWNEAAYYEFTLEQIDHIEEVTQKLHQMCLEAVAHIIRRRLFDDFAIPSWWVPHIIQSWEKQEPTIYGRFDFSYAEDGELKMLEYNADTPTSLLEAAVIQWYWLQDTHPREDQFNSIHERLVDVWSALKPRIDDTLFFASVDDSIEDYITVSYLRDTAIQGGLETDYLTMNQIGWDQEQRSFIDLAHQPIRYMFKLYPWEFMLEDEFGQFLLTESTVWYEPAWKMLLSNKALLPVLWEMFPGHPNLLRSEFEAFGSTYLKKPLLSREGANIEIVLNGQTVFQTDGPYRGPFIYQEFCPLPQFGDRFAAIGSWIVSHTACGMGIRESNSLVTGNTSHFVPHLFVK